MDINSDDVIDFGCAINPHSATLDAAASAVASVSTAASTSSSSVSAAAAASSSGNSASVAVSNAGVAKDTVKMESWDHQDV